MENLKSELKQLFTSYWEYLCLQKACKLDIFDEIATHNNTAAKLSQKKGLNKKGLQVFLLALCDSKVIYQENNEYFLTEKGKYLTDNHPKTLKQACILWGEEHLSAWRDLEYTLQTGKSAFEHIYHTPFFDFIANKPDKLKNYQLAMQEYAKEDYKDITKIIDFKEFKTIADIGGGTGSLIKYIAQEYPNKNYILTDLHEVTDLIKSKPQNLTILNANFFEPFLFNADAIILSRVIHDWNDEKSKIILKNCYHALNSDGKLFIIEIMHDEIQANLLTLNMMLMTGSYERTLKEFKSLLSQANFKFLSRTKLNDLQNILKFEKE